MPVSMESLGIDRPSDHDRLELIDQIWDSLPEHVNPDEVPPWCLAEFAKRRAGAEAAPGMGRLWRSSGAGHEPAV